MLVNGKFVRADKMGRKIKQMIAGGYTCEVCLNDRLGNGIMYFKHNSDRCENIAFAFKEFNVNDEVEIEYNKIGRIYKHYNEEYPKLQ